jgi:hypothetical protein
LFFNKLLGGPFKEAEVRINMYILTLTLFIPIPGGEPREVSFPMDPTVTYKEAEALAPKLIMACILQGLLAKDVTWAVAVMVKKEDMPDPNLN